MRMGDGHFAPQDLRWLDETLSRTGGRRQPLVFITHYPLDPSIANWFEVLDRLKRCNTQAVLVGHGHGNRQLNFEGVPGVMGRSNLRAAKPAGGFTLVEVADGRMTFAEQLHGQSAQALWHSVALGERAFATSPTAPRPDSSVNRTFANVRCRWERSTGWTIAAAPAVWRDLAIVGDASGLVRAFALETGVDRWTFKTGGPVYATADVAGDRVVIASTDGSVYTLNAADGGLCWKLVTGRPIVACPCIADGVVYVGSSEGRFRALDLADGRLRWEFTGVRGFVETRPLVHDGKVVFGAWDGQLYALDAKSGAKVWQWTGDRAGALLSPAACWPVVAAGKMFVVAPDRKMTAIDLRTGAQIWRTGEFAVRESLGLAVDGSRVFVRTMNDRFLAFATEPAEPRVEWNTDAQFGYDINSAQLVERDGTVFFGTKNGVVFALDAATGAVRWQHRLGPALVNTVAPLGANRVLVTDFDGRVALIEVAE
jgi:outer membrane protein assembly factor BamB